MRIPLLVGVLALAACSVGSVNPVPYAQNARSTAPVMSPAKVHLLDGGTAIVQAPWSITGDSLLGRGERYGLSLESRGWFTGVPLDSIVGVEAWTRDVDVGASIILSIGGVALAVGAVSALAVAVFGSCPTIYSDSAGFERLEAEAFSHSIGPLFEGRDVDRLAATPDPDGVLRLVIRNEAAETHYLNHLEVVEVTHRADERVAPDHRGEPLAVSRPIPITVTDRLGVDWSDALSGGETAGYATAAHLLAAAHEGDVHDTLHLELPAVAGTHVGLLLRGRNSLLTTVLLYDLMMAGQGSQAVHWLGTDLDDLDVALGVGRWVVEDLGLRVEVEAGGQWQSVVRLADPGPIAFETMAVMLPVVPGKPTRVRLTFPLDGWRLAELSAHAEVRQPEARLIPLSRLVGPAGTAIPSLQAQLGAADERYVTTTPGQWFTAEFETSPAKGPVTWFVASQGWYSEWMRPDWLRTPEPVAFVPERARLVEAIHRWAGGRDSLETRFAASRFSVR